MPGNACMTLPLKCKSDFSKNKAIKYSDNFATQSSQFLQIFKSILFFPRGEQNKVFCYNINERQLNLFVSGKQSSWLAPFYNILDFRVVLSQLPKCLYARETVFNIFFLFYLHPPTAYIFFRNNHKTPRWKTSHFEVD